MRSHIAHLFLQWWPAGGGFRDASYTNNRLLVLPFMNAGKCRRRILERWLNEDIINRLAPVPELRVVARSTVVRFKNNNDDPQKIGKDLDVQGVLTGRVTQHGDEIAVETDLVRVSGSSEYETSDIRAKCRISPRFKM